MKIDSDRAKEIRKWLAYYGVHEYVEIDPEDEEFLLGSLRNPDVVRCYIDETGGLIVQFTDGDEE